MTQKKSNNHKAGKIVAGVASAAGLTAAAVGAYYLYGHKDAAKNREAVKDWIKETAGEIDRKEVERVLGEAKKHWTSFEKKIKKTVRSVTKQPKK